MVTPWGDMILLRLGRRCPSRRGWLCSASALTANKRHHSSANVGSGVGGVDRIQGDDLTGSKVAKSDHF